MAFCYLETFGRTLIVGVSLLYINPSSLMPRPHSGSKVDRLAVDKTMVTNYEGVASYINRVVPSAYFCQVVITIDNATQVNEGLIHVCVVVATEDLSTVESFNVADVAG